jgi:hypothetical protein
MFSNVICFLIRLMSGFDVVCIKELILRSEAVLVNVLSGFLSECLGTCALRINIFLYL